MIKFLGWLAFINGALSSVASAQTYKNPVELGELLEDGFQIRAVIVPPIVSEQQGFERETIDRNRINWRQREIYLQKGADARVCFHDIVRADADCYKLTAGEPK